MKIQFYIWIWGLLMLMSCGEKTIGFLDATAARYDPDFMTFRNLPLFVEEQGWLMDEFWDHYDEPDEDTFEIYLNDWAENAGHYRDSTPWLSTSVQALLGTQPIFTTLRDVVSPDGGDAKFFKDNVSIWGDGTVEVPAGLIPAGTYILSFRISNEGNYHDLDSAFTVKIIGRPLRVKK